MKFSIYETPHDFLDIAQAYLESAESINGVLLGLSLRVINEPETSANWLFVTGVAEDGLALAALVAYGKRLLLYSHRDLTDAEMQGLVNLLSDSTLQPQDVNTQKVQSHQFARLWAARTEAKTKVGLAQRLYELHKVVFPVGVQGAFRSAVSADSELIAQWMNLFEMEALGHPSNIDSARSYAKMAVARGEFYLWEDGEPVAMAKSTRPTKNGVTVTGVYTPKNLRGNGYASACVAQLSQTLLDQGYQFCVLYTDLTNPTSNSIYQKVGYRPVCDVDRIDFTYASDEEKVE